MKEEKCSVMPRELMILDAQDPNLFGKVMADLMADTFPGAKICEDGLAVDFSECNDELINQFFEEQERIQKKQK